jgi:RNA polymerase sigma-70 factor (ECF subfamily)
LGSSATARFPTLPQTAKIDASPCEVLGQERGVDASQDEALIVKIGIGDKEALSVLFRRYANLTRNIGRKILRDESEADDIVQEVFLYIQRKSGVFDSAKGRARSWIVQVAYSQAFMRRRQLRAHGLYMSAIADNSCENTSSSALGAHYDNTVEGFFGKDGWKNIWDSLTEYQRETLRLHFYEGCTFTEIAEKLGQSYVNIRHHYYRGLEKLRKHADENDLNWP